MDGEMAVKRAQGTIMLTKVDLSSEGFPCLCGEPSPNPVKSPLNRDDDDDNTRILSMAK